MIKENLRPVEIKEDFRQTFIPKAEVIQAYRKIEGGKSRADIEEMLSWYSWKGTQTFFPSVLESVVTYCDFREGSESTTITGGGRYRTLLEVAKRYFTFHDILPLDFTQKIDSLMGTVKSGKRLPPCFILAQPWEYYNGQIVDGVHRMIAVFVCPPQFRPPVDVYLGFDTNPFSTRLRWLKNMAKHRFGLGNNFQKTPGL